MSRLAIAGGLFLEMLTNAVLLAAESEMRLMMLFCSLLSICGATWHLLQLPPGNASERFEIDDSGRRYFNMR